MIKIQNNYLNTYRGLVILLKHLHSYIILHSTAPSVCILNVSYYCLCLDMSFLLARFCLFSLTICKHLRDSILTTSLHQRFDHSLILETASLPNHYYHLYYYYCSLDQLPSTNKKIKI